MCFSNRIIGEIMEKYIIPFEVKQVKEEDEFYKIEGLASTTDIDLGDDVVAANAIVDSVKRIGVPAFRHQHDSKAGPLGVFDVIKQDGNKTRVEAKLAKRDDDGNLLARMSEVVANAKLGAYKGLSIGFNILERRFEDGIRFLEKINVIEISLVDFPMNQNAILTGVKSADTIKQIEEAEKLSDIEDILHSAEFSHKGTMALISKISDLKNLSDSDDSQSDSEEVVKGLNDFGANLEKLKQTMEK